MNGDSNKMRVRVKRIGHNRRTTKGFTRVSPHRTTVYKNFKINPVNLDYKKYNQLMPKYKIVYGGFETWGEDKEEIDFYLSYYAKGYLGVPEFTYISPEEFLNGTIRTNCAQFENYNNSIIEFHNEKILNGNTVKKYMEIIKEGKKLPSNELPFLVYDEQSKKFTGEHEGRHRAMAAHNLRIQKIPVIIYHSYGNSSENRIRCSEYFEQIRHG